jgi:hypothetical protein
LGATPAKSLRSSINDRVHRESEQVGAERLGADGTPGRGSHELAHPAPKVADEDEPLVRENQEAMPTMADTAACFFADTFPICTTSTISICSPCASLGATTSVQREVVF